MFEHNLAGEVPDEANVVEVMVLIAPTAGRIAVHRSHDDSEPLILSHGSSVRFGLGREKCLYVEMLASTDAYTLKVTDWAT